MFGKIWSSNIQECPRRLEDMRWKVLVCPYRFLQVLLICFIWNWCGMIVRPRCPCLGFNIQVQLYLGPTRGPRRGHNLFDKILPSSDQHHPQRTDRRPTTARRPTTSRRPWALIVPPRSARPTQDGASDPNEGPSPSWQPLDRLKLSSTKDCNELSLLKSAICSVCGGMGHYFIHCTSRHSKGESWCVIVWMYECLMI